MVRLLHFGDYKYLAFLQTVCTFEDGALVQHQKWEGKESTITRKLKDGKLVVVSVEVFIMLAFWLAAIVTTMRRRLRKKVFET